MTKSVDLICTWYVHDRPEDASIFPQTGKRSGTRDALDIYMSCSVVFFHSADIQTNAHKIFFTNINNVPEPYKSQLDAIGVEIVTLKNATRAPSYGPTSTWGNQLYIFDILEYLTVRLFDRAIILDSDCVLRADLDDLFADISRYGALTYNLMDDKRYVMNGISRSDLTEIYEWLYEHAAPKSTVFYCGGEFFAADRATISKIYHEFGAIKEQLLAEFSRRKGGEEAHALSLLYYKLGIPIGTANAYIKRCWTTFKYNNLTKEDENSSLCILHLPSEKLTGFRAAYRDVAEWKALQGNARRAYLHRQFGVPRRSLGKAASDAWRLLVEKAR